MAVGWKSVVGIVGVAGVSVGTLYSVLVREPAPPPTPMANSATESKSNAPDSVANRTAADSQKAQPGASDKNAGTPQGAENNTPPGAPKPNTQQATLPSASGPGKSSPSSDGQSGSQAAPDGKKAADPSQVGKAEMLPTFDVARIEPSGDAVIAGRAAPGATVELLRNGNTYARAVADVGGQWAIVPPTLPKGTGELTLRTTSPDGRVAQSNQTVSVRVPEKPGEEVVILLNTPDQPSKVLTDVVPAGGKPVANAQVAAASPTEGVPAGNGPTVANPSAPTPNTPKADSASTPTRANASIRTVEADDAGRFFVTGMAEPGASLRIYLNDTLITSVTAAKDGSFGMTIEKGMAPGDYHVRVDDIAQGSGQVLTRAEVPFAMGDKTAGSLAPAVVATAQTSGVPSRGSPGSTKSQQARPAGATAQGAAALDGIPGAPAPGAGDSQAQGAATGALAQGESPATAADGGATSTQLPGSGSATTPGNKPAQIGDANSTGATSSPSVAVIPEIRTTTIVQGDNLWRISRKIYGQGNRYTWIYDANTTQIRNPNLIYPGQIFVMPDKKQP